MTRIFKLIVLLLITTTANAQQKAELVLMHTSDTHSRIEPIKPTAAAYADMGGLVRRAAVADSMRQAHPHLLFFDCGDFSQGTPYYNIFRGELEVKLMNELHYDAVALGNHEFDYGMENLARILKMADFPIVCTNYDVKGTALEGLVKPYLVIEREGVKVGIFGLSPKPEGLIQASNCQGITYLDPAETAQSTARLLREKEGCDLIICLSHLGLQGFTANDYCDEKLMSETSGIDIILGGHSHTYMKAPAQYLNAEGQNISILHSGKNGTNVGFMKVALER